MASKREILVHLKDARDLLLRAVVLVNDGRGIGAPWMKDANAVLDRIEGILTRDILGDLLDHIPS